MGLAFVLAALLLYVGGNQLLARGSYQSVAFLAINLGFGYWYWLPAIQLLFNPSGEILYSSQIEPSDVISAAWIVLLYHFIVVFVFLMFRDLLDKRLLFASDDFPLSKVAAAAVISSFLSFFVQFREIGLGQAVAILTAQASAREVLTYYNRSGGAAESLLSLWQIINLSFTLFVIAVTVIRRNLANIATALAAVALGLNFLGSGTRTILLMGLATILFSWFLRPADTFRPWQKAIQASRFRYLYLVMLAAVAVLSFYGIAARFALHDTGESYVTDSIVNNNDMMRELAFVRKNMPQYVAPDKARETLNFIRTPANTLTPSFLGFNKAIPYHLIVYNFQRSGIDIENGQGNVFPGIIADHYLVFGRAGPLYFCLAIFIFVLVVQLFGRLIGHDDARGGFFVVNLVSLFVSFRNVQGSLVMTLLMLAFSLWFIDKLRRVPTTLV